MALNPNKRNSIYWRKT